MTRLAGRFPRGLVVGKFAPLHRGHEALIEYAAARCAELVVLSWCKPEPAGCDVHKREHWLRARFPQHQHHVFDDIILAQRCHAAGLQLRPLPADAAPGIEHWEWLAWCLNALLRTPVDALFGSEAYIRPCARHLSRRLARVVAGCEFDRRRVGFPVSASAIRADPAAGRAWLSEAVAHDYVTAPEAGPAAAAAPAARR